MHKARKEREANYRAEAERTLGHLSPEDRALWARHCAHHHVNQKAARRRKYLLIAFALLALVLGTVWLRGQEVIPPPASSSSGTSVPAGMIAFVDTGSCPTGWTQVAQSGNYLLMTVAANADAGTAGGSNAYTPAGTVAAPTFAGTSGTVPGETVSWPAGVPAFSGSSGTVPAETFTGSSATTSAVSAGTPAGTNGTALVSVTGTKLTTSSTGTAAATLVGGLTVGTVAGNATVPAEVFTGSALATHTHTLTAAGTNGTASFTPAGTVAWPVGVPTNGTASFTPAGTNSVPAFSGTLAALQPTYYKVIPCKKS